MALQITSAAFTEGAPIPTRHTCDGEDVSPPLQWSGVPQGTQSLALIADDPDAPAGIWVHWVIYDIPPTATGLPEGVPPDRMLDSGARQGSNDWRRIGYNGPCPPRGTHRYFFKLYALNAALNLPPGKSKADLLRAMEGHILAEAQIVGTYQRQR